MAAFYVNVEAFLAISAIFIISQEIIFQLDVEGAEHQQTVYEV